MSGRHACCCTYGSGRRGNAVLKRVEPHVLGRGGRGRGIPIPGAKNTGPILLGGILLLALAKLGCSTNHEVVRGLAQRIVPTNHGSYVPSSVAYLF
jgi:hypothetical protein